MSEQEEKDKKVGMAVSVGIHAVILLAFFFILAWRAPDPPLPEHGIELNFGLEEAGTGQKQPITPANESEVEEEFESQQQEPVNEPVVEESQPEVQPAEPVVENNAPTEVVTQPTPSPVSKEEVKKPEPKKAEPKPETKKEPVKETKKEEPKKEVVKDAIFPPSEVEGNTSSKANQGDKDNAVGDQGSKEGTLDSRAMHGEQGGGNSGPQLNISGWRWDETPNKKDQSAENGKIVFRFKIDDQGYVVEANTLETTVSPKVTQFYKEQLLRTTFSPTNNNAAPAPTTTGTVTFIITAR